MTRTPSEIADLATWAEKASSAIYLATEASVADDISAHLKKIADLLRTLTPSPNHRAAAEEITSAGSLLNRLRSHHPSVRKESLEALAAIIARHTPPDRYAEGLEAAAKLLERERDEIRHIALTCEDLHANEIADIRWRCAEYDRIATAIRSIPTPQGGEK